MDANENANANLPGHEPQSHAPAPNPEARMQHVSTRVRILRDTFEIFAFLAAGVWGIYTFWYQTSFAPAHEMPALEWKLSLEVRGERADGVLAVRALIRGKNSGKATEQVAAIAVNLFGQHVQMINPILATKTDSFADIAADGGWERQIGVAAGEGELIASQALRYGEGLPMFMVRPDQEVTVDMDMLVPRADLDRIRGRLSVYSIKGNAPIKVEWFAPTKTAEGVELVATDACRATAACDVARNTDTTSLSLWSTPSSPPSPTGSIASTASTASNASNASNTSGGAFPAVSAAPPDAPASKPTPPHMVKDPLDVAGF